MVARIRQRWPAVKISKGPGGTADCFPPTNTSPSPIPLVTCRGISQSKTQTTVLRAQITLAFAAESWLRFRTLPWPD